MLHRTKQAWSVDEFLNWEEQQPERWELIGGQPWRMMAGGTLAHAMIIANCLRILDRQTRGGPCQTLSEQVKVRTAKRVYYPDVFVRCGPIDPALTVIDDAQVILEVISPSTESVDESEKMREYFTLPQIKAYVLVRQVPRRVEVYDAPHHLNAELTQPGERFELPELSYTLTFDEVFEGLPEDLREG